MVTIKLMERLEAFRKNPLGWKAQTNLTWHDEIRGPNNIVAEHMIQAGQIRGILNGLGHLPCSGSLHIEGGTPAFQIYGNFNVFTPWAKNALKKLLYKIDEALKNLKHIPGSAIDCHLTQSLILKNQD